MNLNFTTVIRVAIIVIACILALFFGATLTSDSFIPLSMAGILIGIAVTGLFPEWLVLACIVFSQLSGRTALGFGYWEICTAALIVRWGLGVPFHGGLFGQIHGKFTLVCIAGFTLILLYHGVPALLGIGGAYGRRIAVMAIVSLILSYLLLSRKLDLSRLPLLPWAGLLPGLITSSFDIINLLIPSALPFTFMLYNDQNWELVAQFGGAQFNYIRIAGFRDLGIGLSFLCLCYFSNQYIFNLRLMFMQISGVVVGTALTMIAGYRAFVAQVILGTFIAAYSRSKSTLLLASLCTVLGMGTLLFVHHQVMSLPLVMQRSLSWLPGDWDYQTKDSADDGFDWRARIRDIYFDRVFPDSWVLGRGLVYEERMDSMQWMMFDRNLNVEYFVMMQSYHSGLVSSLDFVGVVGTLFFIMGSLRALWNSIEIFRRRYIARHWHIWTALMFVTASPAFWYTGFFQISFPFYVVTMCLLELARREIEEKPNPSSSEPEGDLDYEIEEASSSR